MDRKRLIAFRLRDTIDSFADHIEKTALDIVADRHLNRRTSVNYFHSPYKTFGSFHGNRPNAVFTKVLLTFKNDFRAVSFNNFQCIENVR